MSSPQLRAGVPAVRDPQRHGFGGRLPVHGLPVRLLSPLEPGKEGETHPTCKFTTDAHHSPTPVEGNCPLRLFVRLVTTRLCRNEVSFFPGGRLPVHGVPMRLLSPLEPSQEGAFLSFFLRLPIHGLPMRLLPPLEPGQKGETHM